MSGTTRNQIAAQIIKAEMLDDFETVARLKEQLSNLPPESRLQTSSSSSGHAVSKEKSNELSYNHRFNKQLKHTNKPNIKVKKFLDASSSLSQMFVHEKSLSASDETKMFMKTASKFSRDDMETKHFAEEFDDSQVILNKSKKHKCHSSVGTVNVTNHIPDHEEDSLCDKCVKRLARHLIIDDDNEYVFMSLTATKPFFSRMSSVVIRNKDHSCDSFIASSEEHQVEVEKLLDSVREAWHSRGYRCIVMETFFMGHKPAHRESYGKHFQVDCLPIKEKHLEKARMYFKQALQESEKEWSMNKKLIQTDGRRIQRYLPRGLSYFWVCFDDLKKGFAHVIEKKQNFSPYFGYEVLSGLLDKAFNPMKLKEREKYNEQFERCRDFKLLYSNFKH